MPLTEEQQAKIEANRQKALALRALRQQQQAAAQANGGGSGSGGAGVQELMAEGGFTREEEGEGEEAAAATSDGGSGKGGASSTAAAAATTRVALAPTNPEGGGCEACGSGVVDEGFRQVFGIAVCYPCKSAREEEYGLLSKGEATAEYCLQEGTIKVMPCLERRNPRHGKFTAMKLYCRKQLRAKAHERWGGQEGLEEELERRRRRKYEAALGKTADVFAKKPRP